MIQESAASHVELGGNARAAIGPDAMCVLLGNYVVVAGGRDVQEAIIASQFVEKAAGILIHAEAIGGVKPIPVELWRRERDRHLKKHGKPEEMEGLV